MDVFGSLGVGIRFDKKRFREDIEIFDKAKKAKAIQSGSVTALPSIDFFASPSDEVPTTTTTNKDDETSSPTHPPSNIVIEDNTEELETEEEITSFRRTHRIKVSGSDPVAPLPSFSHLPSRFSTPRFILKNIQSIGYSSPTPIQMQCIPLLLSGRDVIGCAPTGSGKTLAFLMPIVQKIQDANSGIRALIISPTRELSQQIYRECNKLLVGRKVKACLLSKSNMAHREKKYDILISSPLRLVHAIQNNFVDLSKVEYLVMDEADKLFEMGFLEQVDEIMAACSFSGIQKALFSATISSHVERLANTVMKDPLRVIIGHKNAATDLIDQKLLYVGKEEGKIIAIRQLVQNGIKPPVLVFVESIDRAKHLFHELVYDGINVDVIHSDRTQAQRDTIIQNFRSGKIWVLIATELLARGIDFKGVNMVINYDFPRSVASYIHRIGRTGRAGRRGEAITYFTRDDAEYLRSIAHVMRDSGCDVSEWMLKMPKISEKHKLKQKEREEKEKALDEKLKVKKKKKQKK